MAGNRQPKHDHLKQLIGRGSESNDRPQRQRRDSFHKVVQVTPQQSNVLNRYIISENRYFNNLIELLQPRLKSTPQFFAELSEKQIELFARLAFYSFDVRSLDGKKSEDTELPDRLEPYRDILFGIHGDKELGISDRLSVFYDLLGMKVDLWPWTREYMAYELLDFCITQSKSMKTARSTFHDDGDIDYYAVSPEVLQGADLMQKRHLQLLKKDVEVKWDEENDRTLIKIPYLQNPIKLEALDLENHYKHWNFLIIHQDPQEIILTNACWEMDFRTTFSKYLTKYVECANPNSRMKSRHLRGR